MALLENSEQHFGQASNATLRDKQRASVVSPLVVHNHCSESGKLCSARDLIVCLVHHIAYAVFLKLSTSGVWQESLSSRFRGKSSAPSCRTWTGCLRACWPMVGSDDPALGGCSCALKRGVPWCRSETPWARLRRLTLASVSAVGERQ